VAAYAFSMVTTGNVIARNLRSDRHKVFKLGGKVGHVTRHVSQLLKAKWSKVKVTRSRDVSADEKRYNSAMDAHINFNLVGVIDVGVDACGILSRSVGQTNRK